MSRPPRSNEARCAPAIRRLFEGPWKVTREQLSACFGAKPLCNQKFVGELDQLHKTHSAHITFDDVFKVVKSQAHDRTTQKAGARKKGTPIDRTWIPNDVRTASVLIQEHKDDTLHFLQEITVPEDETDPRQEVREIAHNLEARGMEHHEARSAEMGEASQNVNTRPRKRQKTHKDMGIETGASLGDDGESNAAGGNTRLNNGTGDDDVDDDDDVDGRVARSRLADAGNDEDDFGEEDEDTFEEDDMDAGTGRTARKRLAGDETDEDDYEEDDMDVEIGRAARKRLAGDEIHEDDFEEDDMDVEIGRAARKRLSQDNRSSLTGLSTIFEESESGNSTSLNNGVAAYTHDDDYGGFDDPGLQPIQDDYGECCTENTQGFGKTVSGLYSSRKSGSLVYDAASFFLLAPSPCWQQRPWEQTETVLVNMAAASHQSTSTTATDALMTAIGNCSVEFANEHKVASKAYKQAKEQHKTAYDKLMKLSQEYTDLEVAVEKLAGECATLRDSIAGLQARLRRDNESRVDPRVTQAQEVVIEETKDALEALLATSEDETAALDECKTERFEVIKQVAALLTRRHDARSALDSMKEQQGKRVAEFQAALKDMGDFDDDRDSDD